MNTTVICDGKRYVSSEDDKKGGFFQIHPDDDDGKCPYLIGIPRKGKIDWDGWRAASDGQPVKTQSGPSPGDDLWQVGGSNRQGK